MKYQNHKHAIYNQILLKGWLEKQQQIDCKLIANYAIIQYFFNHFDKTMLSIKIFVETALVF